MTIVYAVKHNPLPLIPLIFQRNSVELHTGTQKCISIKQDNIPASPIMVHISAIEVYYLLFVNLIFALV